MEVGDERQVLAEFADRLCAELGFTAGENSPDETPWARPERRPSLFGDFLGFRDEQLIATARLSLARIAAALGAGRSDGAPDTAMPALLDGAELVMRGELAAGRPVSAPMPGFVFLVALTIVDQDEALELSRRAAFLLNEAMG